MYQRVDDDHSEIIVSHLLVDQHIHDVDTDDYYQCGNVVCALGILILYDTIIIAPLMIGYDSLGDANKTTRYLIILSFMTALWTILIIVNALFILICNCGRNFFVSLTSMRLVFSFISMIVFIALFSAIPEWHQEKSLLFVFIVYIIQLVACGIQVAVSMFR